MFKVFHFDCYPTEKTFQKKSDQHYFSLSINEYLQKSENLEAEIVTCFIQSKFDKKTIDSIKNLKLIITRSVGMDNIDTEYCEKKGIKCLNVEYSSHNVAHHTLALILFHSRNLKNYFHSVKKGNFLDRNIECLDLKGLKLGIIGYGRIGKQVGELAQSFGMEIVAYDRNATECSMVEGVNSCDMDSVLSSSDIITLHCDANPTSIGMINEEAIKKMKQGVILINTARGCILNEKDLIKNIKKFSFVGIDVVEKEISFNKKHPFLKYSNIFITPHIAYKSDKTTKERWAITYKHIEDFIC